MPGNMRVIRLSSTTFRKNWTFDTMIPEAYEGGGGLTGIVTVAGFSLAFLLTSVD